MIAAIPLHPRTRSGLWCLAVLLALGVHAGGGTWLAQWRPAPVAIPAPVMAQLVTRQPEPTPPPSLSAPLAPPVAMKKPPPKPVLAAKPKPMPAPRSEPTPGAVTPPPPVVASLPPAPEAAPAAPPRPAAGSPPVPELAVHCPRRPAPTYPVAARRRGLEGSVQLRVALAASGAIAAVEVIESSGSRWLDEAAAAAVRRWRCTPARIDGTAVPAVALQRITFQLQ